MGFLWKEWCKSWSSSTLATSCEELTHWKGLWCWEELGAGGEGDDRGWDGWMASPTQWMWVWVNSRSWWWTGRPGMLRFMGSQRVGHDWATELNWTDGILKNYPSFYLRAFPPFLSAPVTVLCEIFKLRYEPTTVLPRLCILFAEHAWLASTPRLWLQPERLEHRPLIC